MADYIDRQAAIAALREFAEECKDSTEAATAAAMAISVISRLPGPWGSVEDSEPVLHKRIFLRVGIGGVIIGWAYVGYGGASRVQPRGRRSQRAPAGGAPERLGAGTARRMGMV